MSIEIQIFIGFRQNGELKSHLKQSSIWLESKILRNTSLKETKKDGSDYIGFYIPSSIFYDQLKKKEEELKRQLQIYCPKLNLDKHPLSLFPEIFIV